MMAQTSYPNHSSRRAVIQKPKNVDPPPITRPSVRQTLPHTKMYERESPFPFEGDPCYDWGMFCTDEFTYDQPDATAAGPLQLLTPPAPRPFVQEQILRDSPAQPRPRSLLSEGSVKPFTRHFTPAVKFPPQFFAMRDYLAQKALDRGIRYSPFSSFCRENCSAVCRGDIAAMPRKSASNAEEEESERKACKKQAAYLSTRRPLSTYYEKRDSEWLEKLGGRKCKKGKENLEEIKNIRQSFQEAIEKKHSRSRALSRKSGKYRQCWHHTVSGSNRCKSAFIDSTQTKEDHLDDSQSPKSCLRLREASDSSECAAVHANEECRTPQGSSFCDQSLPTAHRVKARGGGEGQPRGSPLHCVAHAPANFFEECDDRCSLRDRYLRAHILSLNRWASDPPPPPPQPQRHSAPDRRSAPAAREPCAHAPSTLCDDTCLHEGCCVKPRATPAPRPLPLSSARAESEVGKSRRLCLLPRTASEIDCFRCMKSGCVRQPQDAEGDETPELIRHLEAQDKARRQRKPSCHFEGPKIFKPREIPVHAPRNHSAIGSVPYTPVYKRTPQVQSEDDALFRDLAWMRSKISSLLSNKDLKNRESIHAQRPNSFVGTVSLKRNPDF